MKNIIHQQLKMQQSKALFEESKAILVGGVNSPVRSFSSIDGQPLFFSKGKDQYLYSADGQQFIDYVLSWGPLILGHANEQVVQAIHDAVDQGTSFGAPTEKETQLASLVQHFFPSVEKLRFVNSGTEATMSAIRTARGYTKKSYILKFEGCYHGHVSSLLVSAGSGALTHGQPDSEGVLPEEVSHTLIAEYNNLDQVHQLFSQYGSDIAAVIVEPAAGNMGFVLPKDGFLQGLRDITTEYGACLIFDEVMTGFRVGLSGMQGVSSITPDLTTFGKVIGGGMPCGAFGGKQDIMACLSPEGKVYQAGTLSGNPVAMAAGIATLSQLKDSDVFSSIEQKTTMFAQALAEKMKQHSVPFHVVTLGTMFSFYFSDERLWNLSDVKRAQRFKFSDFYRNVLEKGVYLAPSPFEAGFFSSCHTERDIEQTVEAIYYGVSDFV